MSLCKPTTTSGKSESKSKIKQKAEAAMVPLEKLNVVSVPKHKEKKIPKISKRSIEKSVDNDNKLIGLSIGKGASTSHGIGPSFLAFIDVPTM